MTTSMLIAMGLGLLTFVGLGIALFASGGGKARGRLAALENPQESRSPFGRRVKRDDAQARLAERLKDLDEAKKRRGRISLNMRMEQAGLSMPAAQFLMLFQLLGAGVGVLAYFMSGQLLVAVPAGVIAAFGLPTLVLSKLRQRRRDKFLALFPSAIDIIVRGVRSGLPLSECLRVIASEIDDPIKTEFQAINDSVSVGLTLEDALERLAERVPSADVDFFRTVLAIQKQTGGNLAESLANLSEVLRERRKLKGKIRALSAEARMSAIVIGSLPFLVSLAMFFINRDYIMLLFTHPDGNLMVAFGLVWMSFGVMMMRWMIRFDY